MRASAIESFIAKAEEQYRLLFDEASALLRNFDTNSPEEFESTMERRQELIDGIQKTDTVVRDILAGTESLSDDWKQTRLREYREFQEAMTEKIRELDSLVLAFARERLATLQADMAALSRGKVAVHGYESTERDRARRLNSTA